MPAWAALIAFVFKIPGEMAVGLILVASCPGGTASNVVVFLANGRVALSVCLTAVSTLLAIVVTPWLTHLYAGHYLPVGPLGFNEKYILHRSDPSAFWNQSEKILPKVRSTIRQIFHLCFPFYSSC
jgi:BASS family bile acid:Na+ symporter